MRERPEFRARDGRDRRDVGRFPERHAAVRDHEVGVAFDGERQRVARARYNPGAARGRDTHVAVQHDL